MEKNNVMTPEKSLEIISEMMNQGRKDTQLVFGKFMISWGILIILVAMIVGYLWKICNNPVWNALWGILPITGYAWNFFRNKKKIAKSESFIGKTIGLVWMSVGIYCCILGFSAAPILNFCNTTIVQLVGTSSNSLITGFPLCAVMMLFFGLASVATGLILKDYLISFCGVIAGFGGFMGCIIFQHHDTMFILAGVVLVSMIVPGLRIVIKNKDLCSNL